MKVYLAYSGNYAHLLHEAKARIIISYGRKHSLPFGDYLPVGFDDYLLDSGGYQIAFNTSARGKLSVEGYSLWVHLALERHGDKIKGFMGLDTRDPIESLQNYEYMRKEGLTPIPVWKAYWSDDILDYLCREYEWIAIGGVTLSGAKVNLRNTWQRVISKYPKTKVHMLGVGARAGSIFKTFRPYSIDVSTWSAPARFGMELVYDKRQVIRETSLPDADKQRLREDKKYEESVVKKAIEVLQSLETIMNDYHDPYQAQMDIK